MYQNVSDEAISAGDSASFIIAQMTAFGIEAENASHIIDAVDLLAAQKQGELTGKESVNFICAMRGCLRALYTNLLW